jgi:hypothetical protein
VWNWKKSNLKLSQIKKSNKKIRTKSDRLKIEEWWSWKKVQFSKLITIKQIGTTSIEKKKKTWRANLKIWMVRHEFLGEKGKEEKKTKRFSTSNLGLLITYAA